MKRIKKTPQTRSVQEYSPMKNQTVVPPFTGGEKEREYAPYTQRYATNSTPFYFDYSFYTQTPKTPLIIDPSQHYEVVSKDATAPIWGYTVVEKRASGFKRLLNFLLDVGKKVRSSVRKIVTNSLKLTEVE